MTDSMGFSLENGEYPDLAEIILMFSLNQDSPHSPSQEKYSGMNLILPRLIDVMNRVRDRFEKNINKVPF